MTNKPELKNQRKKNLRDELILKRTRSDDKACVCIIAPTRHNSADSVPTSNLVCITEVAIRTTLCIAGII